MQFKLFLFLLISVNAFSAETDPYTGRYVDLPDALPSINQEIQKRAQEVLNDLNADPKKECDWETLNSKIGSKFRRPLYGEFEQFINTQAGLPRFAVAISESAYRNLPMISYLPILIGMTFGIGFAPYIRHDGYLIGSDKFGHFMDEGYYYYLMAHTLGYSWADVLKYGSRMEETLDGLWTSGIYSYGDLSANYDGYRFWVDVLGTPADRSKSRYFSCSNGLWKSKELIAFDHYVSAAWDEGMNCSHYRSDDMVVAVNRSVEELEAGDHKRYQCPVYPDKVAAMVLHYGVDSKSIIHPDVLKLLQHGSD